MLAARASRRAGRPRRRRSRRARSVAATSAPKSPGRSSRHVEQRLLQADRRAAAAASGQLDRGGEREAVPAHRDHARDDQHRDEHGSGASRRTVISTTRTTAVSAIARSGTSRLARTSDHRPALIRPRDRRAPASRRARRRRRPADMPRRSWRKSTAKPATQSCGARSSELPIESCQMRWSRIGERPSGPPAGTFVLGPLAEDDAADRRARETGEPQRQEPVADRRRRGRRRERESGQEPAERDRGLADGQREPSLPRRGTSAGRRGRSQTARSPRSCRRTQGGRASGQKPLTTPRRSSRRPRSNVSPMTSTTRSPNRSVASPHGNRLRASPTSELESRSPVCASERWSRARSAGAITAMPNQIAE